MSENKINKSHICENLDQKWVGLTGHRFDIDTLILINKYGHAQQKSQKIEKNFSFWAEKKHKMTRKTKNQHYGLLNMKIEIADQKVVAKNQTVFFASQSQLEGEIQGHLLLIKIGFLEVSENC